MQSSMLHQLSSAILLTSALIFAPEPVAAQLTKLRASFAGTTVIIYQCMSLLDEPQREGFFQARG